MQKTAQTELDAASPANGLEALRVGQTLYSQGRRLEALPYLTQAVLTMESREAQVAFADCIGCIRYSGERPVLKPLLTRALQEFWIPPANLARVSSGLLLHESAFKAALERIGQPSFGIALKLVEQEPLLLALMNSTVVTDAVMERLLTAARAHVLANPELSPFSIALATQCFANEYAFAETAAETVLVDVLARKPQPTSAELVTLACYRSLYQLAHAPALLEREWPESMEPLLTRQLWEPLQERELQKSIPAMTPIQHAVSAAVRSQYEENPYPRWIDAPRVSEAHTLASWLATYFIHAPAPTTNPDPVEVLVAGCGTGQHSVGTALRFKRANVMAVDLSLASLAYAKRKTAELGLDVTYGQGDILELAALHRQFDLVESAGVLHHLAEPMKGWAVLTELTRPGGYQCIALYSEIARRRLIPVREFVKQKGYGTSAEDLRRFRADAFTACPDLTQRRDFYSLSMLRDLVFHVQEHRFTVPQLAASIASLGLTFCGFNTIPENNLQFRQRFGDAADFLSLEQWEIFENENPDTFIGMYQFLVQKPA